MTFQVFFNTFLPYLIEVLIRDMKKSCPIGIDLWHAVEFSRYGRALSSDLSLFKGRISKLSQAQSRGQIPQLATSKTLE